MNRTNLDIRSKVNDCGLRLWKVAEGYGLSDSSFSRVLRKELPEKEKKIIFKIIDKLKEA